MALSRGASSQSMEEARLAAEYNRKAALAAMFPRVSANGGYMWNSRDAHLLANETQFSFGTAAVAPDGTATFAWSEQSKLGELANTVAGTPLEQPILDIEASAGQKIADVDAFVSAPKYSAVSGTVKAIEPRMAFTGAMERSRSIPADDSPSSTASPRRRRTSQPSKRMPSTTR